MVVIVTPIVVVAQPVGSAAHAQPVTGARAEQAVSLCGQAVAPPAVLPPPDTGPVVYLLSLCFSSQGNVSLIDPNTYLSYVSLRPSRPSQGVWVTYDDATVATIRRDFAALIATEFLDDLRIEADDYVFANGVIGKLVTYHLEERQRIKIVGYEGSKQLDRNKLEEELRERKADLKLDTFLNATSLRRVERAIRQQLAEKGFVDPTVTHTLTELPQGPKLVNVTFHIKDGPKLVIRDVQFIGNRAFRDDVLAGVMKDNRAQSLVSVLNRRGPYKAERFADDAQKLEDHYRDHGYADARVGEPELRRLDDSLDGTTRWIQLRVPVLEGPRYYVSQFELSGNKVIATDALRQLFKIKDGDVYQQNVIRDGLMKAREAYGAAGYMEFTGYPDLAPVPDLGGRPSVQVTMRLEEGSQYLIHRINFTGNVTTQDRVIRRELALLEGGVFNTEALKYSIRRLNQLGYFKPIEGTDKDVTIDKSSVGEHLVDVSLRLEEQNRNQVTFGAGVSQYDGAFGNVAFTTANLLGRGESVTVSGQKGSRTSSYQVSFTDPTVFDRPILAGLNLYSNKVDYLTTANVVGYSQVREGSSLTIGRRLFRFTQVSASYAYEIVSIAASADFVNSLQTASERALLYLGDRGRNTESRVTPTFEFNSVDNPFRPRSGMRFNVSLPVAGGPLGGTTNYMRPDVESVLYVPLSRRTAIGLRGNVGVIRRFGDTRTLPYYLRYFMGGEYQIRGVNLRTVGPTDRDGRATGGTKSVLFNAEYYLDMFGPVRLVLFHDAGQAYGERQAIDLSALRTSSGIEARFTIPVLNMPFRLIYAWNLYRDVFQPPHTFKFAVGTTF